MKLQLSRDTLNLLRLYALSLMMSFGVGMVFPTIPALAASFNVSVGLAAQFVTAQALGRAFSLIPGGMIVDRLGKSFAMLLGPALVAIGACITAVSPFFSLLLLAQFLAGAGDSIWMIGREVAGIELTRSDQRGRVMSGFMGISSAGASIGPVAGGLLTDIFNFRVVFFTYTCLALVVLAFSWSAHEERTAPVSHRSTAFQFGKLREIEPYFRRTYLVLIFATFCMMLYRTTLQSMLPLYVGTHLGFSMTQVGALFGIAGIFVVIMIIPAGIITDTIGRKAASVPSTALPALAFVAFPFVNSMVSLGFLAALIGVANGLSLGSVATSTYDVIPANKRGQFQGLRRTIGEMGGVAGPLLGGILANTYNPGMIFLIYSPLLFLAAGLLAFVSRETLAKKRPLDT